MAEIKILYLTLKKKWFDMIVSGEKKVEYREIKSYWEKRFHPFDYNVVRFTNGYSKDSPSATFRIEGFGIGQANPDWTDDDPLDSYFKITIGNQITL